jgi:plastocyanin
MTRHLAAATVLVGIVAAFAPTSAGAKPPAADDGTVEVRIGDNFYAPKRITVSVGTTVEWRNEGRNEHNVLPDRGKRFGVDDIDRDATYSYRFDKPGRYGYYCSFHGAPRTGQFGTVKVVKAKQRRES